MLKCNAHMEKLLSEHSAAVVFPLAAANKFKKLAFAMAQLQNQVAEHFLTEGGQYMFDITSKTHMVLHCALNAGLINPRRVWCFTGEDFMQHSQRLAQMCTRGNTGPEAANKMISHYRIGLHFLLEDMENAL